MMWLPEWYCVDVTSTIEAIAIIVHNSTLKVTSSFNVTLLQPGTVYNISVIPCNMAGCDESCDIHSVQTESETGKGGEMNGLNPHTYAMHTCRLRGEGGGRTRTPSAQMGEFC